MNAKSDLSFGRDFRRNELGRPRAVLGLDVWRPQGRRACKDKKCNLSHDNLAIREYGKISSTDRWLRCRDSSLVVEGTRVSRVPCSGGQCARNFLQIGLHHSDPVMDSFGMIER